MSGRKHLKAAFEQGGGSLREAQPNVGAEWFDRAVVSVRGLREKADEVVADARTREARLRANYGREAREVDGIYPRSLGNSERRIGAMHHAKTRYGSEVRALLEDTSQQLAKIGDEVRIILGGAQNIRDRHLSVRAALRRATHGHGGRILNPTEAATYRAAALATFASLGPREFVEQLQVAVDDGDPIAVGAASAQLENRDDVEVTDAEVLTCVEVPGLAEKLERVDALLVEGEQFVATCDSLASDRDRPAAGAGRAHLEQGLLAGADRFEGIAAGMRRFAETRPEEMRDFSNEPPAEGADDEPTTGIATLVDALTDKN